MKKLHVLLLSAILLIISVTPVLAEEDTQGFTDLYNDNPNLEAVLYLKAGAIIQGYPDGNFKPDMTINRAEFTKIVISALYPDYEPEDKNCFTDVSEEQWYAKYVCTAKDKEIIEGYPDGSFKPTLNINLAEASKIIADAFEKQVAAAGAGNPWYKPYLKALEAEKAIPVSIDTVDKKVTRSEMSEIIWRLKANRKDKLTKTYESLSAELPNISSCAELKEKVLTLQYRTAVQSRGYRILYEMSSKSIAPASTPNTGSAGAVSEESASADVGMGGGSGEDVGYSQTNVQVEGVDEADIIKNDGEYIYMIRGKTLRIVKAYPSETLTEVAKVTLDDESFYPSEIYVSGDTLSIIGSTYESDATRSIAIYPGYYSSKTKVYVFDVSDHTNPVQKRVVTLDGSELSSRRIGDRLYLILNGWIPTYDIQEDVKGEDLMPQVYDSETGESVPAVPCSDVRFYPRYQELSYLLVASIPLGEDSGTQEVKRDMFMGGGSQVYSSVNNI